MNTTANTILVTGGSAGIGLELAKALLAAGNTVIITGRDAARLKAAEAALPGVHTFRGDVAHPADVDALVQHLHNHHPALNIIVNNAGYANLNNLLDDTDTFEKAGREMLTNYLSIIRLNEKLLPLLRLQPEAAIVNVSSIVAFAPGSRLATYAASKAALHSYSQSLRVALKPAGIKVFELMPPLVNTEFSAEIGGQNGIPATQVAEEFLAALATDNYEIRVANTEAFYQLYLSSPQQALEVMNPQAAETLVP
ncbi:uncharacterized oxidoreductase [Chitinophaga jiangningensis]|uniref:Uncharacterized oxidoreductase n=1 Tax=Chitinophaga jiangningensis TaxID=1419482 RepID=A0A1M7LM57_9BACT|nr:SDR family NAD(P)-dependent oxidoreductase [Chitinophaga jiangningensis]SHM79229.1 uncharacterized oxidoreductase [Chitinophaga jiangningensis]